MTGRRRRFRGIGTERDMNGSKVTDSCKVYCNFRPTTPLQYKQTVLIIIRILYVLYIG